MQDIGINFCVGLVLDESFTVGLTAEISNVTEKALIGEGTKTIIIVILYIHRI